MFTKHTSVGLDVHARSVVATAIDTTTGELFKERLIPSSEVVLEWLARLPGPVAVTYEAGPTGFGLARALVAAQVRCEVAAPSKLSRPAGERVKTDARDALQLAKLLRNDDITSVRVPTITQESARDLVRAREDVRGDLMRARRRVSKLLLRHGHVYYGGKTWSAKHHAWLQRIRFDELGTQCAYRADLEAIEFAVARRDRLDAPDRPDGGRQRVHRPHPPAVLPARHLNLDRIRARGRDRRLASVRRAQHRRLSRPGAIRALQRPVPSPGIRSPKPATATPGGC